jgi:hypothetical protein
MFWYTNMPCFGRYGNDGTLAGAMQVVHELADGHAQTTLETFDGVEGLDAVIVASIDRACRSAMGPLVFNGAADFMGKSGKPVLVLPTKDGVGLHLTFRVGYRFRDLNNASNFVPVFRAIYDNLTTLITERYPDVRVGLTHNGRYKNQIVINLTVSVRPSMQPMRRAA